MAESIRTNPSYSQERSTRWLSRLARGMQRQGQTVFLIEQLQPSWLSGWRGRYGYAVVTRIVGTWILTLGVSSAVLGPLLSAEGSLAEFLGISSVQALQFLTLFSFLFGTVLGILDAGPLSVRPAAGRGRRYAGRLRWWLSPLFSCALVAVGIIAYESLYHEHTEHLYAMSFMLSGVPAVVVWTLRRFGDRARTEAVVRDIGTVEQLTWRWLGLLRGFAIGLAFVPPLAGLVLLIEWGSDSSMEVLVLTVQVFLIFVAFFLFIFSIFRGMFTVTVRENKATPNQGIRLSLLNSVRVGSRASLIVFVFLALLVPALQLPLSMTLGVAAIALMGSVGLLAGLWFGGLDVLQHYTLRVLLAGRDQLPWDLAHFLDFCTDELHILQRVGGGYMFLHRYLLEHFADLGQEAAPGSLGPPS